MTRRSATRGCDGGTDLHTGQLFFDDATSDEVYASHEAYAGRADEQRTRNDQDGILAGHEQEPGFFVELAPVDAGDLAQGYGGTITVGVATAQGYGDRSSGPSVLTASRTATRFARPSAVVKPAAPS